MTLHRFASLCAGSAFFLLIAGAMVTSTGSGLAVPDWPLSYGQVFPPMKGGVFFEHGHRVIAFFVALMTGILVFWVWARESRRWVRALAAAAAAGILLQALLGGLTVLYGLPKAVSIAHACLGQTVFCLLVAIAHATSSPPDAPSRPSEGPGSLGRLWVAGAAAVALLFVQLVLGASLRHTGQGLIPHLLGAVAVFAAVAWTAYGAYSSDDARPGLLRPAAVLLLLLPVQFLLGLAALTVRSHRVAALSWPTALTAAHLACGAALLAFAVLWTLRAIPWVSEDRGRA